MDLAGRGAGRDGSELNDRVTQLLTGQQASWWEMLQQT